MLLRGVFVVRFMVFLLGEAIAGPLSQVSPVLDDGPVPALSGPVPAPALWPSLRHEKSPRLLVLASKGQFLSSYQAIARRLHGTLEARYLNGSDALYHVNDKWIEPKDTPTQEELTVYARQVIVDTVQGLTKSRSFDVVFVGARTKLLADSEIVASLLSYVQAGGIVVVTGNFWPDESSALAGVWPAAPTKRNSWMKEGSTRESDPALAGVPTERLTAHTWIPLAEPAHGGRALATGEAGAIFATPVGKGTLLYCPTGPMSSRYDALETLVREYDHDEIWLRYWDQVLSEMLWGEDAFPAYGEILEADDSAGSLSLNVQVANRSFLGTLVSSVHVVDPLDRVVYEKEVPMNVAPGTKKVVPITIPVAPSWGGGLYRVYFTLGDQTAKQQVHQALTFVAVPGTVKLEIVSKQTGYRIGETAQFTVTASSPQPWVGKLVLCIYDFRARVLELQEQAVKLDADKSAIIFSWPVVDHGVRVDTYRVVVAAMQNDIEWARAESIIDKQERWSTRNEYQWSSWSALACQSACTVLPAMRLMAHAGFNALGYSGGRGIAYSAERWGWRYYNEGIGSDTWSPVIEYENDAEIEAQIRKKIKGKDGRDLTSSAYVLASVGEEAGFKSGWGKTYYWDTPVAPEKACRAFQGYLKTHYPNLDSLNANWHTRFKNWQEVQLTKEFSSNPQNYMENDGWAHPVAMPPLGEGATGVSLAPFSDTRNFYAWYYDRYIAIAERVYHEQLNPVSLTLASAPSSWVFASRECDVPTTGPGGWNESQTHSLDRNESPSFALVWGHFDWRQKDEDIFWGFLMQRTGHNDYWSDALMFNGDMTHTRATMALREWTAQLAGHEQAILDSVPALADIGVLVPNGLGRIRELEEMKSSLLIALMQGGFEASETTPAELSPYKIVFAVGRQALSSQEAAAIQSYVEDGGTFVFTSRFANQNEFGGVQPMVPGYGLAAGWGLSVKAESVSGKLAHGENQFVLDAVAPELKGNIIVDGNRWRNGFREEVKAEGWTIQSTYPDSTPALLTRTLGKGKLVYLNAVYASHHYIQWRTPTDAGRQGFFKLTEWLSRQAGAQQTLRLEGELDQTLHTAVKQFTDSTGHIRYVIFKNSIQAPWTNSRLQWTGEGTAVYDVLTGARYGTTIPCQFRPNQGRWLAVLEQPVKQLEVEVNPSKIVTGSSLRVTIRIRGENGQEVAGKFPLNLSVMAGGREIPGLNRAFSLVSGGEIVVPTARNETAGEWTICVTDGITGMTGRDRVEVKAALDPVAPSLRSLGWPSEISEPPQLSVDAFLDSLQRLAKLYQVDQSGKVGKSWLTKQQLGAYYDFFPGTRHSLLRPLYDVDWIAYVPAWREALAAGGTYVLTGEDLGIAPGSGLAVYPHGDAHQFKALVQLLRGATWQAGTRDGDTLIASLGKGRLILSRESIDAAGHTNEDVARWQQRWLAELAAGSGLPLSPPDEERLRRWWMGESLSDEVRTVTWFEGNQREVVLNVDPTQPLDSVFTLVLPPSGRVKAVDFSLQITGTVGNMLTVDVGCDDTIDATVTGAGVPIFGATLLDWPDVVARYLSWREAQGGAVRDDNNWRLVPVRVRSAQPSTVTLHKLKIEIK